MPKTFQFFEKFGTNWNELEDCRALRRNLLNLEIYGCHKFNFYLFSVLCIVAVVLFLMFLLSWSLFCILRTQGSGIRIDNKPPPPMAEE